MRVSVIEVRTHGLGKEHGNGIRLIEATLRFESTGGQETVYVGIVDDTVDMELKHYRYISQNEIYRIVSEIKENEEKLRKMEDDHENYSEEFSELEEVTETLYDQLFKNTKLYQERVQEFSEIIDPLECIWDRMKSDKPGRKNAHILDEFMERIVERKDIDEILVHPSGRISGYFYLGERGNSRTINVVIDVNEVSFQSLIHKYPAMLEDGEKIEFKAGDPDVTIKLMDGDFVVLKSTLKYNSKLTQKELRKCWEMFERALEILG